jgi:hydroxymethylpyrimidine/phosphomethylpyrimidine kinase
MNPKVVLSVAGTDSGGAAGLAADLVTFAALEVHGACVVTAVTAQDTTGIQAVHPVPTAVVAAQLDAVLDDLPVSAAKTGLLGSAATVRLVATRLDGTPLVVDPVLVASTGARLADEAVRRAYLDALLPVATVVTPNVSEARALLDADDLDAPTLAEALSWLGPAALVTGGPDPGSPDELCTDWLALPGRPARALTHPRVPTGNDHGTGCTFSAALAVGLAHGDPLAKAAADAGEFTARQLRLSRTWTLGRGPGPIAHLSPIAFTKENP